MEKKDYGIDAPKVIRNLFLVGIVITALSILFPIINIGSFRMNISGFIWSGLSLIFVGLLMVLYSKFGKFKHRDRMLGMIDWKGDEQVLDVGTGLGLLMIGAAKKLKSGKAVGIDIFASSDLSNNTIKQLKRNAELEHVSDRIEIVEENIIKTSLPHNSYDVILSNLCLHNIPKSADREKACEEISRLLKPSGALIISDFKHTGAYAKTFRKLGMTIEKKGPYIFSTFPPLTIIYGKKPGALLY